MEVAVVRVQLFAGWLRWGTYEPRTVDNMVNPIFRTATKLCLHDTEKTGPSDNEADVGDFLHRAPCTTWRGILRLWP